MGCDEPKRIVNDEDLRLKRQVAVAYEDEAVKAAAEALRDEWPLMLWSDRDAGAADRAALYAARVAVEAARPHIDSELAFAMQVDVVNARRERDEALGRERYQRERAERAYRLAHTMKAQVAVLRGLLAQAPGAAQSEMAWADWWSDVRAALDDSGEAT